MSTDMVILELVNLFKTFYLGPLRSHSEHICRHGKVKLRTETEITQKPIKLEKMQTSKYMNNKA
jgi:hypothetical protein